MNKYKDSDSHTLRILTGYADGETVIQIQQDVRCMGFRVDNEDALAIAAELLQIAGHHYLAGYIEADIDLRGVAAENAANEAARKLQERRDAIAQELSESGYDDFDPTSPFVHAIDRIIELEDARP